MLAVERERGGGGGDILTCCNKGPGVHIGSLIGEPGNWIISLENQPGAISAGRERGLLISGCVRNTHTHTHTLSLSPSLSLSEL